MENKVHPTDSLDLPGLFAENLGARSRNIVTSEYFSRSELVIEANATVLVDRFPNDANAPKCAFLRFRRNDSETVQIAAKGHFQISTCPSGGWLIVAIDGRWPSYWIPQTPSSRTFDGHKRIVSEHVAPISGIELSTSRLVINLSTLSTQHLDCVIWQIPAAQATFIKELQRLIPLERQATFTWSSQSTCESLADVYRYLIYGHVYQNALSWPRRQKFCCELDGYELFIRLSALELSTKKTFYNLIRRQIVYSVITRQAKDGGWYHGEWTDKFESHYRFHSGALLLLESALQEWPDVNIKHSLQKGAAFVAGRTDDTKLGKWFLHDSLEQSPELMDEMPKMFAKALPYQVGRGAWKPSYFLGKSPTNKMVFNTHLDTLIALDRYSEISDDDQYHDVIASAHEAALALLSLRPAATLYRLLYKVVYLALLPSAEARALPLPIRAIKRFSWKYLAPQLYRLKWHFPRIVMPDGFIDRHLSPLHFDAKYHAVNVLDLVRLSRRFPDGLLQNTIDEAIHFVLKDNEQVLRWWGEGKPRRFAVVVFTEALYQLCVMREDDLYREQLARTLLTIEHLQLGLPPSLWGGNSEVLPRSTLSPCPCPKDSRLRIANLSNQDRKELLLVNPSEQEVELEWINPPDFSPVWSGPKTRPQSAHEDPAVVPAHGWLICRERHE